MSGAKNWEGKPLVDDLIWDFNDLKEHELRSVVKVICDHLNLTVRRTNQTQHGQTDIVVEKDPE